MATEKKSISKPLRIGLWLLIGVLILLAGIYALRGVLIAPYAAAFLERTVAAETGLQITIGQFEGNFFSNIAVKNVTTVKRLGTQPLAGLQVRRLKLSYRLWDLLKGRQAFQAGSAIEIEGAHLSIDLTGEPTAGSDADALENILFPAQLRRVNVQNSSLQIQGPGYETILKGVSLTAHATDQGTSVLRLQVAQWSLDHPDLRKFAVPLEAELSYTPQHLQLEKLLVNRQPLVKSAVFELHELPDRIPFDIQFNLAGGRLAADGRLGADQLEVAFSGSDLDLSSISGLLAPTAVPFGGHLTLKGHLDLPFDKPRDLVSDLRAQVANGSIHSTTIEQLAFRFSADPHRLEIADLALTNGPNRLSISQASAPADIAYGGDPAAFLRSLKADWSLAATDVPAVLKLFGLALAGQDDRIPSHRLILNGRMEDGTLIIPEGRLNTAGGHILLKSADIELPIGERTLRDSKLAGDLSINLPDLQVLSRIFALPDFSGTIQGQIKVSGTFLAPQGTAGISGRGLTFRNRKLGNLTMRAKGDLKGVTLESVLLERGQDRANGRGTINLTQESFEGVKVKLSVSDLAPYFSDLLPLFLPAPGKIVPFGGGLKAAVELSGPFSRPSGSLKLQAHQLRVASTALGDANIDLKFSDDKLQVFSAVLRNRNDSLDLSGSIRLQQEFLEDIRMKVAVTDLAAYQGPWLPPALSGISGSLHGRLQAAGDLMLPQAQADLRAENFRLNDLQLEKLTAKISSSGRVVRIESAAATMGRQQVVLAGDIRRNPADTEFDVALKKAALIREGRTLLALEREAGCRLSRSGRVVFDNLTLSGAVGRVSVNGRFEPDGASNLLVSAAGLNGDGWLDLLVGDRLQFQGLNARIKIAGRPAAPSLAVEGTLDNIGSPGFPMAFAGRFNLEYGNKGIKIHQFVWQGAKGQLVQLTGEVPLDLLKADIFASGPIMLNGRVQLDDAGVLGFIIPWANSTGGSIQCDLNMSGTWRRPVGALHLEVRDLKRPAEIRPLPPGPYAVTGDVTIDGSLVSLASLEAYSSGWKVLAEGQWRGAPTLPDLLESGGHKLTGQVNLTGSLAVSDLSWVAREVDGVRRLSGRLEARGNLQGPITAPGADAVIKLSEAEIAPDVDMPSLQGLNLEAAVTPQAVNVRSLHGNLGGAPFELTGTWKLGAGSEPAADLKLHGENILLFRDESLRLRADTDLTLKGPLSRLALAGEVAVTDGRFTKTLGILEGFAAAGKPKQEAGFRLFSFRNPPLRDLALDVRITAKEPFIVRNNLARGSVRPDLVLTGTGEVPLLVGKVYVESTRLYLPAGRMQLENGLVRFEKTDPDRPKLDLIGTSTMLGYDIKAVVEGPYDEPVITLSSVPPLPNDQLLMLLLAGQPPKNSSARSNSASQSLNVAVFLGRDFIGRLFGSDSDESLESILDRFDVQVGKGITQSGEDTINSQFRIADNVLRKGDSLYLTGERDYFDYYNWGIKLVFRFR
ncbi:MAG: translocation/assembly module TamB domain-containing protein [Desulfobacterales bacterium]